MTNPTPEEQRFHWSEGNKYALEAMKSLLWLNGGAAAVLLTFFGGRARLITPAFGEALVSLSLDHIDRGLPQVEPAAVNHYYSGN
jgi:hypothetical protein